MESGSSVTELLPFPEATSSVYPAVLSYSAGVVPGAARKADFPSEITALSLNHNSRDPFALVVAVLEPGDAIIGLGGKTRCLKSGKIFEYMQQEGSQKAENHQV